MQDAFNDEIEEDGTLRAALLDAFPYSNGVAGGVANMKVAAGGSVDIVDGRPC